MFLSGLLSSRSPSGAVAAAPSRPSPRHAATWSDNADPSTPEFICDESQLRPPRPVPDDVRDLNESLAVLAAVFPDVQMEVFREMLVSFSEESRLHVVSDAMLRNPATWVKGRRRLRQPTGREGQECAADASLVPASDGFRAEAYKMAVRRLALHEFKGLSKSAIYAVLSEYNYSYLDARPTLVRLSSKSWKFTISSVLFRRKAVTTGEAEKHPLVVWKSCGRASTVPAIKSTGDAELDRELFQELIMPLKRRQAALRDEQDRALALSLHKEEAEACEAIYECSCCFTEASFEEFTSCHTEGHMVCFRCVQYSVTEAVYGQGWQRSINKQTGTLCCPAVSSTECAGWVSGEHMRRALLPAKNGADLVRKLDERLAEHELMSSKMALVRCPFCNYAEVDELYMPATERTFRSGRRKMSSMFVVLVGLCVLPLSGVIVSAFAGCVLLSCNGLVRAYVGSHLGAALDRHRRRHMSIKFRCRKADCGRTSCMTCGKEWVDVHVCHESSLVALRTQVETAMSLAIKRVCPRCNTSFVKTHGCNKMVCVCGYKMCYVCRKDLNSVGYQHFCPHFRPQGDGKPCRDCSKCNLWETEDTDEILRQARLEAERNWLRTERRHLSAAEKAYLETGVKAGGRPANALLAFLTGGRMPSVEEVCDSIVDLFCVYVTKPAAAPAVDPSRA